MLSSSTVLAQFYGIILAVSGLAVLMNKQYTLKCVEDIKQHPGLQIISAIIPLLLGAYLVINHNIWHKDWTVILTIVGWMLLFSGVYRHLFPGIFQMMIKKSLKGHTAVIASLVIFIVGLVLLYFGFNL